MDENPGKQLIFVASSPAHLNLSVRGCFCQIAKCVKRVGSLIGEEVRLTHSPSCKLNFCWNIFKFWKKRKILHLNSRLVISDDDVKNKYQNEKIP